ncbi:MAG: hypothetical protein AB1793_09645 [Candidatus Thermoplasmatota archaeon]
MRVLTTDVFCGAYLMTHQGARLVDLIVDGTGVRPSGTFVFEGDDLLEAQQVYSRGEAIASVKEIRDGVTHLRTCLARALRRVSSRRHPEAEVANL